MLLYVLFYLTFGIVQSFIGPLANKISEEIRRFKLDCKRQKVWNDEVIPKWKRIGFIVTLRSLGILFYPLLYIILIRDYFYDKTPKEMVRDESLLYFNKLAGAGILSCKECDFNENIVSFFHGTIEDKWSISGHQCQKCGAFHKIDSREPLDRICNCSGELERELPVFCPICKGKKLKYQLKYIT